MSAPNSPQRYRVLFTEHSVLAAEIFARSESEARRKARGLWNRGSGKLVVKECRLEDVTVLKQACDGGTP